MAEIKVLSQETIDKIAAGEVVERPSSAVKELVENALDAGASAITVEIKEGGISFLRVTDNGCGISRRQVPTAFLPHATSKITDIEDLFTVQSLGFRGEALSSIAAVAQVELITKTYGELTGTRYVIEGSKEKANEEIGAPEGTTFIVRNLFFNTPARRKFLKSATTEGSYIADLIERLSLSHPAVSFQFINNGQTKLHTSGNANEKDLIYHIYGRDIAAGVLAINKETERFTVRGYVGKPLISRGNRNLENYFINGRYIKSPLFAKAIEDAYKGFLMQHQYPFCVLHIAMDSALLDVNVHPNKMELRFSDAEAVYRELYEAVREVLTGKEHIASVPVEDKKEKKPAVLEPLPEPFEKRRISDIRNTVLNGSPYEAKYPQRQTQRDSHSVFERLKKSGQDAKKWEDASREAAAGEVAGQTVDARKEAAAGEVAGQTADVCKEAATGKLTEQTADARKETAAGEVAGQTADVCKEAATGKLTEQTADARKEAATGKLTEQTADARKEAPAGALTGQTAAYINEPPQVAEGGAYGKKQDEAAASERFVQQNLWDDGATGFLTKDARRRHKVIGQLFETYWLIEYEDKLFIIDQHAAHEKVLYEQTMKRLREGGFTAQSISPPIILSLSRGEEEMLTRYGEQITRFGYEIEHFGGREYALNALPAEFEHVDMRQMFVELLNDCLSFTGREEPELILEKVASMSCKAAVKANQKLSASEIGALLDDLLELDNPYHCPHGRPTIISMTKYEIEKKFKRVI